MYYVCIYMYPWNTYWTFGIYKQRTFWYAKIYSIHAVSDQEFDQLANLSLFLFKHCTVKSSLVSKAVFIRHQRHDDYRPLQNSAAAVFRFDDTGAEEWRNISLGPQWVSHGSRCFGFLDCGSTCWVLKHLWVL